MVSIYSAKLTWQQLNDIDSYEIRCSELSPITVSSCETSHTLSGLMPSKQYSVEICAVKEDKKGAVNSCIFQTKGIFVPCLIFCFKKLKMIFSANVVM